eukprot:scaffold28751_cov63-Phaeocystis_antarctica.AAC.1
MCGGCAQHLGLSIYREKLNSEDITLYGLAYYMLDTFKVEPRAEPESRDMDARRRAGPAMRHAHIGAMERILYINP